MSMKNFSNVSNISNFLVHQVCMSHVRVIRVIMFGIMAVYIMITEPAIPRTKSGSSFQKTPWHIIKIFENIIIYTKS